MKMLIFTKKTEIFLENDYDLNIKLISDAT